MRITYSYREPRLRSAITVGVHLRNPRGLAAICYKQVVKWLQEVVATSSWLQEVPMTDMVVWTLKGTVPF